MTPKERAEAFFRLQSRRLRKGQDTVLQLLSDLEDLVRAAEKDERFACSRVADKHLYSDEGNGILLQVRDEILARGKKG